MKNVLMQVTIATLLLPGLIAAQPQPVRNDVPRLGQQEIVMMRHAYLDEGGYEYWYQESSQKVWPWFERLGARILGDFEIVYPQGEDASPGQDEALRFARYASYEHWQATRPNTSPSSGDTGGSQQLAGDGELFDTSNEGLNNRRQISQGSRGGYFLRGYMAENRPVYMPGLGENFQLVDGSSDSASNGPYPVRLQRAEPRDEILVLEYRQIKKGSFEEFHAISATHIWPYAEKVGIRPVGEWQVLYLPYSYAEESEDYDEVYTLLRYASYEHYLAAQNDPVSLGGNGPDFEALLAALVQSNELTLLRSTEFLRGQPFGAPPHYTPGTGENFQLQ